VLFDKVLDLPAVQVDTFSVLVADKLFNHFDIGVSLRDFVFPFSVSGNGFDPVFHFCGFQN
jgi:hypothetical protein